MRVKQISIFMENKPGLLCDTTKFVADQGINLRALSVADSQNFGIIRMIVDDADKVDEILTKAGYVTKVTSVLALDILDKPGMFADVLSALANDKINIEYAYAFTSIEGKARMIFRVDDNDKAEAALAKAGIKA